MAAPIGIAGQYSPDTMYGDSGLAQKMARCA
jgi:hypothetical protein